MTDNLRKRPFWAPQEEAPKERTESFWVGYDVGKLADYSAISILQQESSVYTVKHLVRLALGMAYPAQVQHVRSLVDRPPLAAARTRVVCDFTGVGSAVFDLLVQESLNPIGIHITAGSRAHWLKNSHNSSNIARVPKRDLVNILQVFAQDGRLKIAKGLKFGPVLAEELQSFEVRINKKAHDSYGAWREGAHDDLLLSIAVSLWAAEHQPFIQPRARIIFTGVS